MTNITKNLLLLFSLFVFAGGTALADSAADLKQRMRDRQPALEKLWSQGKIGENNLGYLSPRSTLSTAEDKLVKAENADRKAVYALIGKQTGKKPEQVGAQRALKIAQGAAPGLWLQNKDGKWYKK